MRVDSVVLAFSVLSSVGCAGGIDAARFSEDACCSLELPALGSFVLPEPVDFVEIRYLFDPGTAGDKRGMSFGTPCKDATTPECEQQLATTESTTGWPAGRYRRSYLLINRGETVSLVNTLEGLRDWLGSIDNAAEAIFLAAAELDGKIVCQRYSTPVNNVLATSSGWELYLETGSGCGDEAFDRRVYVSKDGEVEILESDRIADDNDFCGG
jgi:hypothetical protein